MDLLHQTDYIKVMHDKSTGIFEYHWTARNKELDETGYQRELLNTMIFVHQIKPELVIANTQQSTFVVHLEMQKWLIEHVIAAAAQAGMKKLALIVSQDFITQISIEQSIEDTAEKPFTTQYFGSVEKGRNWLMSFVKD
ncbi:MAG: hypothetical protein HC912_05930 [Saprospiraceae bacterium]|nr:hypothetical protein [Saprospiraceae bacterium]